MAGPDAYAGLLLTRKLTSFWNKWPFGHSVRDRGVGSNPLAPTKQTSSKPYERPSNGPFSLYGPSRGKSGDAGGNGATRDACVRPLADGTPPRATRAADRPEHGGVRE